MRQNSTLVLIAMTVLAFQGAAASAMGMRRPKDHSYIEKLEQQGALSRCANSEYICSMKPEELEKASDLMDREGFQTFTTSFWDSNEYRDPETPVVAQWISENSEAYYRITREGYRSVEREEAEDTRQAVEATRDESSFKLGLHTYVSPKVFEEMQALKANRKADMMEQSKKNEYLRLEEGLTGMPRFDGR